MKCICWFEEIGYADTALAGGKGANPGELTRAVLPVPPGFCLTSAAYKDFIHRNGIDAVGKAAGPAEFRKLMKGEILIALITNPVWTPLFAVAGAVVTEVGGILSHGAIVVREYGIPARIPVPGATHLLRDGERVIVNGNSGIGKPETEI